MRVVLDGHKHSLVYVGSGTLMNGKHTQVTIQKY